MPIERRIRLPIQPPFGGIQGEVSPRGLAPRMAVAAKNCWMRYGTIDVRDPFYVFSPAATWMDGVVGDIIPTYGFMLLHSWAQATVFANFPPHLFVSLRTSDYDYYVLVKGDSVQNTLIEFPRGTAGYGCAVVVGKSLYIIHSGDTAVNRRVFWLNPNFVAQNMGIARHTGAWTATRVNLGAGGFASGTVVHHRFTYLNSDAGIESGPSEDEETTHSSQSFDVQLTIPDSADSQVDKVRVYRMVDGLDDTWFQVGDYAQADPTVVTDTNASIDKSFDQQLNLAADVPPISRAAAWHKRRMWYAPVGQEGVVIPSELDRPSNVDPLQAYEVGGDNGQRTRFMFSLGGYLFVLRTTSLWAISGDGLDNFAAEEVHPEADCVESQAALAVGNHAAFWVGSGGIYQLDGRGIKKISYGIDKQWAAFTDRLRTARITLAWDGRRELLWVCVPWYGDSGSDLFIYDPRTGNWSQSDVKLNYILGYGPEAGTIWGGLTSPQRPYGIDSPNLDIIGLKTPASPSDDWRDYETTAIDWHWQGGELDLGADGLKRFSRVAAAWNPNTPDDTIKVGYRLDGDGSFVYEAGKLSDKPATVGLDVGRLATTLALRVEGHATKQTRVTRLRVDGDVVGVAP